MVVLGTVSCVNGNLTAGEFVSFSLYNTMLIGPVRRLGRIISEMSKAGVSIDEIFEITKIDRWFLSKLSGMAAFEQALEKRGSPRPSISGASSWAIPTPL